MLVFHRPRRCQKCRKKLKRDDYLLCADCTLEIETPEETMERLRKLWRGAETHGHHPED